MRAFLALALLTLTTLAAAADAPNPPLPTESVRIDSAHGSHAFTVEVAADFDTRERGLMFRRHMAADTGMLFDFHTPQEVAFWMKNTILPLDMLFVRADGTIANIAPNAVPYSETPLSSFGPVVVVIELNAGRAAALGLHPGDRVEAPELSVRH